MFEENLQFSAPSFGVSGQRRPSLKPVISDFAPSASYPAEVAQPTRVSEKSQTVPDAAVLPDFLLHARSVPASSIDKTTPWSVRKPFLFMFLAAFVLVGVAAVAQTLLDRQFAQAASVKPPAKNLSAVAPAVLGAASTPAAQDYQTATNSPKSLDIAALNIHAKVNHADFTENGNLTKSINANDAAWSSDSAKPGKQGAMIIGSNTYSCAPSNVFSNLKDIALGADVLITNGAGVVTDYKVIRTQVVNQDKVNLEALSDPPVHYRPGLNIVTCAGDSQSGQRLVVNAVLYQ